MCDLLLISIPAIALVSDIFNNNEDLLSTRGTTIQNWLRPAKLESTSYWSIMFLYFLNMGTLAWAFIAYYVQNTDENKLVFEEHYVYVFIVGAALLLVRFIILFIGRWFVVERDYQLLSEDSSSPLNAATALNAPLLTYIFDMSILASISFLSGMLEELPRSYKDRNYMIVMVELSIGLSILKILIGKNKV